MTKKKTIDTRPLILAPAGSQAAFLAAIAAGADAVYCGLKALSARMAAVNFTLEELVPLVALAHANGVKVYITVNSLVKPDELEMARDVVARLTRHVRPDALIIQDLAYVSLARLAGFSGELHLSTLANVSFGGALNLVREKLNVDRVVLPRELNIDEIKAVAGACPDGMSLEVFIHGALCFGVSGRCYWSSYMGGKSGLRGRCVQPCRRRYTAGPEAGRFFSCQDLSLDVLAKVLLATPQVSAWKIEGRKKGPHYVYYTVQAYRMLRDEGGDPKMKKAAVQLLAQALGRPGTHYNFLPQRPQNPVNPDAQTGSGLLVGRSRGPRNKPYIVPREALLANDLLRTGYEDDAFHSLHRVRKYVPKRGRYYLKAAPGKGAEKGTPVFLVDRQEPGLAAEINALASQLDPPPPRLEDPPVGPIRFPGKRKKQKIVGELTVFRRLARRAGQAPVGHWLGPEALAGKHRGRASDVYWWLPPVIWPAEEAALGELVDGARQAGGRHFVLNAPWQTVFFRTPARLDVWAGPFCNLTNPLALNALADLGFSGAIVSPELGRADVLSLPARSQLPLGIVLSGHWPLCVARGAGNPDPDRVVVSPRGEQAWVHRHGANDWIFPNWKLDLTDRKNTLTRAGYQLFIHLEEPVPRGLSLKRRPGLWNWEVGLK